jgi:hypothetical protein
MTTCDDCGTRLDEDDECGRCNAERSAKIQEMRRGDWRAALAPAGPWRSREDHMREVDP